MQYSFYFARFVSGKYKKLSSDAVPSIFTGVFPKHQQQKERTARRKLHQSLKEHPDTAGVHLSETIAHIDVGNEEEVSCEQTACVEVCANSTDEVSYCRPTRDASSQCSIVSANGGFRITQFADNPKAIQYYTGFDDYQHFMFFLSVLCPAAHCLNYQCRDLSVPDHLFLTLMKLRQAKDDTELAILFHLSDRTIARILRVWVNFMYFQLKELHLWPSKTTVQQHMPLSFGHMFPQTRVILDATEFVMEKPSHVAMQSSTFSTYKNKNTIKTMIGCTPRGAVSFISESYGGSTTDRQIIERSTLCTDPGYFSSGDSIMADRGIMVQDLFASKNVAVNTPHMLKGKSQLEPEQVVRDRRVAAKRIHIERVIGLAKTYKILAHKMSCKNINDAHKIIFICFVLTNFRNSIVGKFA